MLKNRIMIGAAVAAAAIVPVAGVSALAASPAGAAAKPGINCTSVTGTRERHDDGGQAQLQGLHAHHEDRRHGQEHGFSVVDLRARSRGRTGRRPASPRPRPLGRICASGNVADELITGNVTADNTKATTVGAAVSGEICATVTATGKVKLKNAPGVNFVIAGDVTSCSVSRYEKGARRPAGPFFARRTRTLEGAVFPYAGIPNHRWRRVDPNSTFDAAISSEASVNVPTGVGPPRKLASNRATCGPPNSM